MLAAFENCLNKNLEGEFVANNCCWFWDPTFVVRWLIAKSILRLLT